MKRDEIIEELYKSIWDAYVGYVRALGYTMDYLELYEEAKTFEEKVKRTSKGFVMVQWVKRTGEPLLKALYLAIKLREGVKDENSNQEE